MHQVKHQVKQLIRRTWHKQDIHARKMDRMRHKVTFFVTRDGEFLRNFRQVSM